MKRRFTEHICDLMGEDYSEVMSKSRKLPLPDARKIICWVLWHKEFTQKEIAYVMDYADHSTVSTNIKKVNEQRKLYDKAVEILGKL